MIMKKSFFITSVSEFPGMMISAVLAFILMSVPMTALNCSAAGNVSYIVRDGEWLSQIDGKTAEAPTPNGSQLTESGWYYWLYAKAGPPEDKETGLGLYFCADKTSEYSFVRFGGPGVNVNGVHFSQDGKMFIVESTSDSIENKVFLDVYNFNDKSLIFNSPTAAAAPIWIDSTRFLYSFFESGTKRGRPAPFFNERLSISIYDTSAGQESLLKKATATSDFHLAGLTDDSLIVIWEEYVKSPGDWADPDKADMREIVVKVPPAAKK
jgi:hypothetical protein